MEELKLLFRYQSGRGLEVHNDNVEQIGGMLNLFKDIVERNQEIRIKFDVLILWISSVKKIQLSLHLEQKPLGPP